MVMSVVTLLMTSLLCVVLYLPYCVCLLLLQLPPSLSPSEKLKEYFEEYGSVKEVTIKYDRDTQKSRSDPVLTHHTQCMSAHSVHTQVLLGHNCVFNSHVTFTIVM